MGCVFPAQAGMNRITTQMERVLSCVPRTGGDEPVQDKHSTAVA